MKLLITGGCGFLGSNLAQDALERGDELVVFDNLVRQGSRYNLEWLNSLGQLTFVHGDIRNSADVSRLIADFRPDAIFHLAGQVAMTTSIANPRFDFETNVMGTFNILEAVRQYCPATPIIYSSTNKVYGDLEQFTYREEHSRFVCIEHPDGFDETVTLDFHSPYGCSKGSADQYMLDYARIYKLKTVVFRHSSMYGGRQFATYDQGWVGWFCQKAIETLNCASTPPFTISGTGKQVRDLLHGEDMKRLYMAAFQNIDTAAGHAFNIGGGFENSLSLIELFDLLEDLMPVKLRFEKVAPRESDQCVFIANTKKAENILKWKPKVSAREGVTRMLDWTKNVKI
tara:strand:+ start:5657 stop:6682 length:1026 start_codon:yes stop_codon:yes gene_type:complete